MIICVCKCVCVREIESVCLCAHLKVALATGKVMLVFNYSSYILNPNLGTFAWFLQASLKMGPGVRGWNPLLGTIVGGIQGKLGKVRLA